LKGRLALERMKFLSKMYQNTNIISQNNDTLYLQNEANDEFDVTFLTVDGFENTLIGKMEQYIYFDCGFEFNSKYYAACIIYNTSEKIVIYKLLLFRENNVLVRLENEKIPSNLLEKVKQAIDYLCTKSVYRLDFLTDDIKIKSIWEDEMD
jgi:hypothetical protein